MDIPMMHDVFRTLGQKMGMHNIRAILPESIDVLINQQIIETTRTLVRSNTTIAFNDRVSIQHNSISPINALRSLYKKANIAVPIPSSTGEFVQIDLSTVNDVMYYTSFAVIYDNKKRKGCRLIEGDKIDSTLNDYCSGASWDYPIVSIYADATKEYLDLYYKSTIRIPNEMVVNYIEKPSNVKLDIVNPANNINCNLPDYLHYEIVEGAVTKYFKSIGATDAPVQQTQ